MEDSHNQLLTEHPIPLLAWPNLLSLDAVLVALAWQQLMMRSFCNRTSTWSEIVSLASTVWLIYVADRLLDAVRLDLALPHTLRHRFYHRHRRAFLLLWIIVLVANVFVVVQYLPPELLRNGLMLASAVLVYGASVHFVPNGFTHKTSEISPHRAWFGIPKEIRVGFLFACGVSLTTWTQLNVGMASPNGGVVSSGGPWWILAAAICAMAGLFSWNCILVARFELAYDRAQSFFSIVTEPSWLNRWNFGSMNKNMLVFVVITLLPLLLLLRLPLSMLVAVIAGAVGLSVSLILPNRTWVAWTPQISPATFDIRNTWVDAVLWIPPVVMLCLN